jgi:hypothetical protein
MVIRSRGQQGVRLLKRVSALSASLDDPTPPQENVLVDRQNSACKGWSHTISDPCQERLASHSARHILYAVPNFREHDIR